MRNASGPRGLILVPTRELASQIAAVLEPLAAAYQMKVTTIYGGVPQNRQIAALKSGVDILVACPGRLEDLVKQRFIRLDTIEVTILDEADHMADLGFLPAVTRILAATPARGHRMLFSATLDNDVDKLVKRFLRDPVTHSVDTVDSPVAAMTHHVFHVAGAEAKKELVHYLASGTGRRLLFMRTKHQARKLARQLTESGVPSVDLHGNLSQPARDRNLAAFTAGKARVLVATDIAARGVHVDAVELVVHVDPPADHKAYLHRSGRTARAGSAGDVVTLALPEQRKELQVLMRRAGIDVRPEQVAANSATVQALVGEVAPYTAPVAPKAEGAPSSTDRNGSRPRRTRSAVGRQRKYSGSQHVQAPANGDGGGRRRAPQRRRTSS
jgi:superfamily II DNA/RNA helicase